MRLVFEFDADGPGEQEPAGLKADDADFAALERYARQLADGMSGAFPFRFGAVYTEAGFPPAGTGSADAVAAGAVAAGPGGGVVLTRAQIREWTGLDLTPAEMGRLASCIPGSSIPDAIGVIVTDAMGLSGPGEEDEVPAGPVARTDPHRRGQRPAAARRPAESGNARRPRR